MATIAENLQTIQNIKQNIKTAIENKGVDMTNTPFSEYSTKIDEITTGGGSSTFVVPDGMKFRESTFTELPNGMDFSNVTNMSNMFFGCTSLTTIPLINTSNVTNMYNMFYYCNKLTTIPLINTSNVTNMSNMFRMDENYPFSVLESIPQLDTSNVKNMEKMLYACKSLTTIPLINTSNVTNMSYMFFGCSSLTTIPLINTSNVANMSGMFRDCTHLTTIPLIDTSNVTDMYNMFNNCTQLTTIPLIDTSNVTDMDNMFHSCRLLQSIPLLDCSKVKYMSNMFGSSDNTTLTEIGGFKNLKISITSNFLDKAPNLTTESLMNVINNVYDLTGNGLSGQTLKFGSTNLNKLTEEQIAVATTKGWTLTA